MICTAWFCRRSKHCAFFTTVSPNYTPIVLLNEHFYLKGMKSYLRFSLGSNLAGNLYKKCDPSSSIDCQWPALSKWNVRIISWVYHRSSLTCSSHAIFTAWLVPISITSDFFVLLISHRWSASYQPISGHRWCIPQLYQCALDLNFEWTSLSIVSI